jgi:peroxiredoxin Q/BCP
MPQCFPVSLIYEPLIAYLCYGTQQACHWTRTLNIDTGSPLPDFQVETTDGSLDSKDLAGTRVVLYFYPKDSTPGCTNEAKDFTALLDEFKAHNTRILGVSRESIRSHNNFIAKQGIGFPLISDPDETLCKRFDVMQLKKLYGREYMGIDRSTFLADETGVIRQVWRNVKVPGHAQSVLEAVKAL